MDQGRSPRHRRFEALGRAVVHRQHVVLGGLDQPEPLQFGQHLGMVGDQVTGLAVVAAAVVELPDVVVERRQRAADHDPRCAVLGHRAPAPVIDAPVGEHLEVLQIVPFGCVRVLERVEHAAALHRGLLHTVDHGRLGQPGNLQDRRCHVDDVGELRPQTTSIVDPVGPVHDGAVAGAAPVRGDLLGPLERCAHRPRPAHRVVVVGARRAELVHLAQHELGSLQRGHAVEVGHLVEGAVHGAFGRGPVVADDVVDEGVVEDTEIVDRVDQPADVVVGVLQEPGVHLHLPGQHRLQVIRHVVPGRDLGVPRGQFGFGRDDPQLLLPGERTLPLHVPPVVELTLVLVGPLLWDVVGGVRRAGGEVDEERLVRHQGLLLTHPSHGAIGQILGQVISLFGGGRRLNRGGAVIERRIPLVVLATDEPVEGLEPAAARRPRLERTHRRGLPHRHLVALAELGGGVPVQLQRHRQRRFGVRPQRAVARSRGRGLGDAAHPHRVMVAARQQRGPGGRAECRRVEAVVPQTARREPIGDRRATRTPERARRPEPDIVEQHDQNIRRTLGRQQRLDRRERGIRVLRVIGRQTRATDGQESATSCGHAGQYP